MKGWDLRQVVPMLPASKQSPSHAMTVTGPRFFVSLVCPNHRNLSAWTGRPLALDLRIHVLNPLVEGSTPHFRSSGC